MADTDKWVFPTTVGIVETRKARVTKDRWAARGKDKGEIPTAVLLTELGDLMILEDGHFILLEQQ